MKTSTNNNKKISRQDNPFRVLGIAMIVDQRGIGARMIARYPSQQPATPDHTYNNTESSEEHGQNNKFSNDDLFFSLTSRQIEKLFRTKKSLCGQPMTLTVNGTVFCCRAILMHNDEDATAEETVETTNQLELFSVIVALRSPVSHTSVPFSWIDGATEDQLDLQRFLKEATAMAKSGSIGSRSNKKSSSNGSVSSAFLSIRRVHISLARYCRVLEREEKRCHYVSEQANHFFRIRNERQKKWEQQKVSPAPAAANPSSASVMSSSTAPTVGVERRNRHVRQKSVGAMEDYSLVQPNKITPSAKEEQEKEQDILEVMLSAFQHEDSSPEPLHDNSTASRRGNLVRELVQVFHSLSRNDYEFPPTPTALLCERDGVVYCNNHIAIPIEAASLKFSQVDGPLVRPYYTLLFAHASPSQLLDAFQSSGSAAPQRLEQVLLSLNPQKPLSDIAIDANLPLYTLIQISSYLITHGACVASPVVSRSSKLSCLHIEKIPQFALDFSHSFANVNFFRLVSFLTTACKTLGEAMSKLTDVESDEAAWLRECLAPSVRHHYHRHQHHHSDTVIISSGQQNKVLVFAVDDAPKGAPSQTQQSEQPRRWVEEMEEMLYAMAIWLLSHRVLTQTQEYLVVADSLLQPTLVPPPIPPRHAKDADENLLRELLDSDFLNGNVSMMALSWRLGLSQQKLRSWALRHDQIRVVSRIPAPGDDWEFEPY